MPNPVPAGFGERLRAEDRRLLINQIRLACWNILFVAISFTLGDAIFIGASLRIVHVLNLGVCGILASALLAIRLPKIQQGAVPFALIVVAAVYFCAAAAAIVRHDAASTPIFVVIVSMGIGAVFAWDIGPQLATVALAGTAMAWNVYAVNGKFGALGHNAILAVAIAMTLSVWMTYRRKQFRFEMALRNLEHERAEARRASEDRLYQVQQEDAAVTAALAHVRQEMISSLSTPVLLDRLCQLGAATLECDCSHTVLWEPKEEAYAAAAGFGDSREQWEGIQLLRLSATQLVDLFARLDREEIVEVRDSGQPRDRLMARLAQQYGVTASLYVALRRGRELIGYQHLGYRGRTEPFTPRQHRLARGIADTASVMLENARLVEELEQVSRFKSDFLAAMSHELRTPLNVVIGYGDLLLDRTFGGLADEQAETIGRMVNSARELLDLVNATLDLSRFERKRTNPEWQEVWPAQLVDQLARETLQPARSDALEISWDIGTDLPSVRTDPIKLRMVLKNLVDNAIKFTERGAVTVNVRAVDRGVEFSVRDTGIGIPPEAHTLIFEPFQQVNGTLRGRYGGVGLGLYIVRRLLEMMGGHVVVESEVGRGSTFRVWVPSEQDDAAPHRST